MSGNQGDTVNEVAKTLTIDGGPELPVYLTLTRDYAPAELEDAEILLAGDAHLGWFEVNMVTTEWTQFSYH